MPIAISATVRPAAERRRHPVRHALRRSWTSASMDSLYFDNFDGSRKGQVKPHHLNFRVSEARYRPFGVIRCAARLDGEKSPSHQESGTWSRNGGRITTGKSASVQRSAFPAPTTLARHQRKARFGPRPRRRDRRSATRAVSAELYAEWLRAQRPIKPGEPHAALAAAGDGKNEDRYDVLISALRP